MRAVLAAGVWDDIGAVDAGVDVGVAAGVDALGDAAGWAAAGVTSDVVVVAAGTLLVGALRCWRAASHIACTNASTESIGDEPWFAKGPRPIALRASSMAAWKPVGVAAAFAVWVDDVVAVTTPALGAVIGADVVAAVAVLVLGAVVGAVAGSGFVAAALVGAAGVRADEAVSPFWLCEEEWVSDAAVGWVDGPESVCVCFERCAAGEGVCDVVVSLCGVAVDVPPLAVPSLCGVALVELSLVVLSLCDVALVVPSLCGGAVEVPLLAWSVVVAECAESAFVGSFGVALLGFDPSGFFVPAVPGLGALWLEFVLDDSSADATPVAFAADAIRPMPTALTPNQCV